MLYLLEITAGWFKDIGFWVEKNNVEIFNLEATYGDGQKQRLETRLVFDAGSRSRLIHLENEKRRIRSISFTFKTVGNPQARRKGANSSLRS